MVIGISGNQCTGNECKLYLIAPGIYYTQVLVWISVPHLVQSTHSQFCPRTSNAFIVLYSYHQRIAFLSPHTKQRTCKSVKVFVNIRCFRKWRSFICATNAPPSFDKNNYHPHTYGSAIMFQGEIRIKCNAWNINQGRNYFMQKLTKISTALSKCWKKWEKQEQVVRLQFGVTGTFWNRNMTLQ